MQAILRPNEGTGIQTCSGLDRQQSRRPKLNIDWIIVLRITGKHGLDSEGSGALRSQRWIGNAKTSAEDKSGDFCIRWEDASLPKSARTVSGFLRLPTWRGDTACAPCWCSSSCNAYCMASI